MKPSTSAIILVTSFAIAGCANGPDNDGTELPDIVEVYACGDYCPGPEEKYVKRIYDGVTDEEECRTLGGRLYTYFGWGQHVVCEVR